ncbi:MAG: hypothetical protein ACTSXZ_10055, partial [Alphaproteobacteria bacterium]
FLLLATSVNLEMNFPSFDLNLNYAEPQGFDEILHNFIRVVEILLYDPIFPLGFQIYDEDFAREQIQESAYWFGNMWSSIAAMFEYLLYEDTGRQADRAVGFNDTNLNFQWDEDETMTLRIGDAGLSFTRTEAQAIVSLSYAMERNFLDREPFPVQELNNLLAAFGLEQLDFVIDLLDAWFPEGTIDLSTPLYEPTKNGFRNLLEVLLEKLRLVEKLFTDNDLDAV